MRPLVRASLLIAVAALTLSGCSEASTPSVAPVETNQQGQPGTDAGLSPATFDFTYDTQGPSSEITVEIGEDLREAAGSVVDDLMISRVVITPRALDGVQLCAADLEFSWTDPALPGTDPHAFSGTKYPLAEFDETSPTSGLFLADDLQTGIRVRQCASSAVDLDRTAAFEFRTKEGKAFASVEYVLMVDRSVSIAESEVNGMRKDANGMWIGG